MNRYKYRRVFERNKGSRLYGLGQTPNYKPGDLIEDEVVAYNDYTGLNLVQLGMSYVPAGTFIMGSPTTDTESTDDERPQHQVTLTRPMAVLRTPVTQAQWFAVMGTNPANFEDMNNPVETVSWNEANEFCDRLSAAAGIEDESAYRLLTEAEWEYACRAGSTTPRYGPLDQIAWYKENSGGTTHPVGQKLPNAWGLYDMLGNVYEWTQDRYGDYSAGHQTDPAGPKSSFNRVRRGGGWNYGARGVRAAGYRGYDDPGDRYTDLGFRICRTLNT